MNVKTSKILRLNIFEPEVFVDYRGEYIETYNRDIYSKYCPDEFIQDDISTSRKNVLRGLHGDAKTWKLIQCLVGSFYLVVVDNRPDSPTFMKWEGFVLSDKQHLQVLVPAGFLNGHYCLTDVCMFSYKQTQCYTGPHDQVQRRYDDKLLGIRWPLAEGQKPIMSERDEYAKNP